MNTSGLQSDAAYIIAGFIVFPSWDGDTAITNGTPCRSGRCNTHNCRCRMGKTAAGDIAAGTITRDQTLAKGNARIYLGFKFLHAFPLRCRKAKDLLVRKLQIFLELFRDRRPLLFEFLFGQDDFTRPVLKLCAIMAKIRILTIFPNVFQDAFDNLLRFTFICLWCFFRFFQICAHFFSLLSALQSKRHYSSNMANSSPELTTLPEYPSYRHTGQVIHRYEQTGFFPLS